MKTPQDEPYAHESTRSPQGVHKESTRSPQRVHKEPTRSPPHIILRQHVEGVPSLVGTKPLHRTWALSPDCPTSPLLPSRVPSPDLGLGWFVTHWFLRLLLCDVDVPFSGRHLGLAYWQLTTLGQRREPRDLCGWIVWQSRVREAGVEKAPGFVGANHRFSSDYQPVAQGSGQTTL